jgi:hypothetical protein
MTEQELTANTMRRTAHTLLEEIHNGDWDAVLDHSQDLELMAVKMLQDAKTMEGCSD